MTTTPATPWRAINERLYMLTFAQFCAALELEPDGYADEKYADVKALAKAMARVSAATLETLTEDLHA